MIAEDQIQMLKLAKGYKDDEPALVDFNTLVSLIEERDNAMKELQEVLEENQKLREKLKRERKANASKERDYLTKLKNLEAQIDKANISAREFLVSDLHRKLKVKQDKKKNHRKKIFTKTELLLGEQDV